MKLGSRQVWWALQIPISEAIKLYWRRGYSLFLYCLLFLQRVVWNHAHSPSSRKFAETKYSYKKQQSFSLSHNSPNIHTFQTGTWNGKMQTPGQSVNSVSIGNWTCIFFIGRFFSILESWNPRRTGTLGVSAAGHNQSPCAAQVILQIICMHSAWTFLA